MIDATPPSNGRLMLLGTIPHVEPGTPLLYDAAGEQIVVTRHEDSWCAFVNQCPHAGAPLADGISAEGSVTCGRHGWTFDLITGQRTGNWSGTATCSLNLRTVVEKSGMLYLRQPEPTAEQQGTLYLVRYGIPGWVSRFRGPDEGKFPLRESVLIRTERGLETGELLAIHPRQKLNESLGEFLRPLTEDERLQTQERQTRSAELLETATKRGSERGFPQAFVDAETLWDGQTAIIYYLGPHGLELADLADSLAGNGLEKVRFQPLIEPPPAEEKSCGCGSGGCHS